MSDYNVRLVGTEGDEMANVTATPDKICRVILRYRNRLLDAEARDCFEAFCKIRVQLEEEGLKPFCYGASLNVFPSGMSRDMGGGMKAYRLTPSKKAALADLVNIFEAGPDVIPATVAQQKSYFEHWLNSIKRS